MRNDDQSSSTEFGAGPTGTLTLGTWLTASTASVCSMRVLICCVACPYVWLWLFRFLFSLQLKPRYVCIIEVALSHMDSNHASTVLSYSTHMARGTLVSAPSSVLFLSSFSGMLHSTTLQYHSTAFLSSSLATTDIPFYRGTHSTRCS